MRRARSNNLFQALEKASLRLNTVLAAIAGIVTLAMMMLVVVDVSGRYLLNKPLRGGIETEQIMLAYIIFFSLAYGLIRGAHVRVSLILERLPRRVQVGAELLAGLMGVILFALLTWGGWQQFWESWVAREYMPAAVKFPYWLPKLAVPLGVFFMAFQFLVYFVAQLVRPPAKERGG